MRIIFFPGLCFVSLVGMGQARIGGLFNRTTEYVRSTPSSSSSLSASSYPSTELKTFKKTTDAAVKEGETLIKKVAKYESLAKKDFISQKNSTKKTKEEAAALAAQGMARRNSSGAGAEDQHQQETEPSLSFHDAASQLLMFRPAGETRRRRRLLVEDMMALEPGDAVLLVILPHDKENYRRFESLSASFELPSLQFPFTREFTSHGVNALQFMGYVETNPHGSAILDGSHLDPLLCVRQGEGITFRHSGSTTCHEFPFSDIYESKIQLFDTNPRYVPTPDFYEKLSKGGSIFANISPIFDQLQEETWGDPLLACKLVMAVKNHRAECKTQATRLRPLPSSSKSAASEQSVRFEEVLEQAEEEVVHAGAVFVAELQAEVTSELHQGGWTSPLKPIFDVKSWIERVKTELPLLWAFTAWLVPPSAGRAGQEHRIVAKDVHRFLIIVGGLRKRNSKSLVDLGLVFGLAAESSGFSLDSQLVVKNSGLSTSDSHTQKWLRDNAIAAQAEEQATIQIEDSISAAFDNFQRFSAKKYQIGQSSSKMDGTVQFVKRQNQPLWPPGTIIECFLEGSLGQRFLVGRRTSNDIFNVLYHLKPIAPTSLVEPAISRESAMSNSPGGFSIVALPKRGYRVVSAPGLTPQPTITYYSPPQQIPIPMGGIPSFFPGDDVDSVDTYSSELGLSSIIHDLRHFVSVSSLYNTQVGSQPIGCQAKLVSLLATMRTTNALGLGRTYQHRAVQQWNAAADEVSSLKLLTMSKHSETDKNGFRDVIIELFVNAGQLEFTGDDKKLRVIPGAEHRSFDIYGDRLSIMFFEKMKEDILVRLSDENSAPSARALLAVMDLAVALPGDLHILMHMLCAIFILTYGGFLQAFQAALRMQRITMDAALHFQNSRRLAVLVFEQLKREIYQKWSAGLVTVHVRAEWASANDDPALFGKDVAIGELGSYNQNVVMRALASSIQEFISALKASNDKVVQFTMEFFTLMSDFVLFDSSVKVADSIAVEFIIVRWMAIFAFTRKMHYVLLVACCIESAYEKMSAADLQRQRINRFVRLNLGKGCIGMDAMCELMNWWMKKMREAQDIGGMVKKSAHLALMRRCASTVHQLFGASDDAPKATTKPKDREQRIVISNLIRSARLIDDLGRTKFSDDTVWGHVAECASKKVDEPLSERKSALSDVFGRLATSRPMSLVDVESELAATEAASTEVGADTADVVEGGGGGEVPTDDGFGDSETENEEEEEEKQELTAKERKKIERMKRYPVDQRIALKGSWLTAGAELLKDFQAKREAEKAAMEKSKQQLNEAVLLFEADQMEERKMMAGLASRGSTSSVLAAASATYSVLDTEEDATAGAALPPLACGPWYTEYKKMYP